MSVVCAWVCVCLCLSECLAHLKFPSSCVCPQNPPAIRLACCCCLFLVFQDKYNCCGVGVVCSDAFFFFRRLLLLTICECLCSVLYNVASIFTSVSSDSTFPHKRSSSASAVRCCQFSLASHNILSHAHSRRLTNHSLQSTKCYCVTIVIDVFFLLVFFLLYC